MRIPHLAFRFEYSNVVGELLTPSIISNRLSPNHVIKADNTIWDTGASGSAINISLASTLNLPPIGRRVIQGAHGSEEVYEYTVQLQLPNNVILPKIAVAGLKLGNRIDALIGMDIIMLGDFAISNGQGKTTFTYAVPPFDNKADLLEKANKINPKIERENKRLMSKKK